MGRRARDGTRDPLDLTACDREPIHVPGAIQPHGLLLIADRKTLRTAAVAGDVEGRLTPSWSGRPLDALLAQKVGPALAAAEPGTAVSLTLVPGRSEAFQASAVVAGGMVLVALVPAPDHITTATDILARLDAAGSAFERAIDVPALCARAAAAFRDLTGFDRVMIYRFLDDGAGVVVAENRDPALDSFANHHFPANDIPQQARTLYIRNRVRVIADVDYAPAPIRPADHAGVDLSDVGIRSISPIHVQYLKNMGVRASASISIVKDGLLWGLVACHNRVPRDIPHEMLWACATLAGVLARQVRAKEDAEIYRERIRLRGAEDAILASPDTQGTIGEFLVAQGDALRDMLDAEGFAAICGREVIPSGTCPSPQAIAQIGQWLGARGAADPFATRSLPEHYPDAAEWADRASGLLAVTLAGDSPVQLLWFRAEQREIVEWAGNPHKGSDADPRAILTPRSSFESWREEVRYRARPWTLVQIESAVRLRRQLFEARQARRLRELNRELNATVTDKEALISQKDHLLREVNHRVQNSLQLVQAFLSMQERAEQDAALSGHLQEAQRRIGAVALVHRRLYQADQVETIDLARYLEELIGEMRQSMGAEWSGAITFDLAPILISADRAVNIGLILTELVINANKYAYGGASGPIAISLEQYRTQFRLIVADHGGGPKGAREGFGTRMMKAMVQSLDGTIERSDNRPGLRVIVTAAIEP